MIATITLVSGVTVPVTPASTTIQSLVMQGKRDCGLLLITAADGVGKDATGKFGALSAIAKTQDPKGKPYGLNPANTRFTLLPFSHLKKSKKVLELQQGTNCDPVDDH